MNDFEQYNSLCHPPSLPQPRPWAKDTMLENTESSDSNAETGDSYLFSRSEMALSISWSLRTSFTKSDKS